MFRHFKVMATVAFYEASVKSLSNFNFYRERLSAVFAASG